ncbi:hypothetical protein Btru_056142 [Bulinus truncatus]|nr:hypothetical protein Btru_056142 [Bulinus truncatus]
MLVESGKAFYNCVPIAGDLFNKAFDRVIGIFDDIPIACGFLQDVQKNPLGAVTSFEGELSFFGRAANGLFNSAKGLAFDRVIGIFDDIPIACGFLQDVQKNPLGAVTSFEGELSFFGRAANGLFNSAKGLVSNAGVKGVVCCLRKSNKMRHIIVFVALYICLGSVLSFVRHPGSEAEDDVVRRSWLGGLSGSASNLVNYAEAEPQRLLNNPFGTVKGVISGIPMAGGVLNGALDTATGLVGGLPIAGGLIQGAMRNPVGAVQGLVGGLPLVGGPANRLINTAGGLINPQGELLGLDDKILENMV